MAQEIFDVAIIGAGPAGVTAGIYALRYNLKTIVISPNIGGWISKTPVIENWPGVLKISGVELAQRFQEHLRSLQPELVEEKALEIKNEGNIFTIKTEGSSEFKARAIILATGSEKRKLNVPGEQEFLGRGVSYCATCDGPLFRGKRVAVVGGGDSAAVSALMLSEYAEKVYIIVRESEMIAKPARVDQITAKANIEVIYNTTIKEMFGDKMLQGVRLSDGKELEVEGVFVEIGMIPNNKLAKQLGLELDTRGLIVVREDQSTSIEGVFAAGDVSTGSNRFAQIISAAAEGAIAANSVYKSLKS
ncbi:thioredoxin reductase [Candidatus Woesearchaeota archaeon]|nr:FAD-dependent oxidoreductase [Candidatus Woesearchaeota archaeon]RLE43430.1 MAG: thioredoxin reductase [Candidatus Woesearchaeota archaeon]